MKDKIDETIELTNFNKEVKGEKMQKKSSSRTKTNRTKTNSADAKCEEITLVLADIQKDDMFRRRLKKDEGNIEKLVGLYRDNMEAVERNEKPLHEIDLILVWYDASCERYVLLGGCHRLEALRRLGITEFQVRVLHGSEDKAFAAASLDNTKHGKELKKCDKKYSVKKSLERYGDAKTFDEIASEVGCVKSHVSKIYKELFGKGKRTKGVGNTEHSAKQPNGDGSDVSSNPKHDQENGGALVGIPGQSDTENGADNGSEQMQPTIPTSDGDVSDGNASPFTFGEIKKSTKTIEERKKDVIASLYELREDMNITESRGLVEEIRHWCNDSDNSLDERQRQRMAQCQ